MQRTLCSKVKTCKTEIDLKQQDLRETQTKADMQLLEHRSYLDRKEREFQKELDKLQRELDRQERIHSDLIGECHLLLSHFPGAAWLTSFSLSCDHEERRLQFAMRKFLIKTIIWQMKWKLSTNVRRIRLKRAFTIV